MPIVAMEEIPWRFPPYDEHVRAKGEPLHDCWENWDRIEEHIREIGGEAFSWQYMQGAYAPVTTGQRTHYVEGQPAGIMIGRFDPTWVTLEDLAKLRNEYEVKHIVSRYNSRLPR